MCAGSPQLSRYIKGHPLFPDHNLVNGDGEAVAEGLDDFLDKQLGSGSSSRDTDGAGTDQAVPWNVGRALDQ